MFWSIAVPDNTTIIESQGSGVELELGDLTSLSWEEKFVEVTEAMRGLYAGAPIGRSSVQHCSESECGESFRGRQRAWPC